MIEMKTEYRLIHDALNNRKVNHLYLGRRRYDIAEDDEGGRSIDYDNIRFRATPPTSRKRFHYKTTWATPHSGTEAPFLIDQMAMMVKVNNATIGIDIANLKENAAGTNHQRTSKGRKAKGSGGKMDKKP